MLGSRASAARDPLLTFFFLSVGGRTRKLSATGWVGSAGCPRHGCRGQAPMDGFTASPRCPPTRPALSNPAFTDHLHPRGVAPLAGTFLTLRNACCGSVLTTTRGGPPTDQRPEKLLRGSHFYAALILINGLVVIGLHNGGPFGTARRQSLQREGASGGSSTDPTGTGSAEHCHWGAAAAQVPTGSGRRLRLRGWGRNRPPLTEWGRRITTPSHFPLNAGKSL